MDEGNARGAHRRRVRWSDFLMAAEDDRETAERRGREMEERRDWTGGDSLRQHTRSRVGRRLSSVVRMKAGAQASDSKSHDKLDNADERDRPSLD